MRKTQVETKPIFKRFMYLSAVQAVLRFEDKMENLITDNEPQ